MEELTPEARAATNDMVEAMFAFFVGLVEDRRPLDSAQVRTLADGRVYREAAVSELPMIETLGRIIDAEVTFIALDELSSRLPPNSVVTVDGIGSAWTNSGDLFVGFKGDGMLTITGGGAVSNAESRIGDYTGSTGSATVDGTGSTWTSMQNRLPCRSPVPNRSSSRSPRRRVSSAAHRSSTSTWAARRRKSARRPPGRRCSGTRGSSRPFSMRS